MMDENYHLYKDKWIGDLEKIVILNEERRKNLNLPPLKPIDYNTIDKVA